ncbi:MAG TPA: VOC family protein [Chloroflexota bacterium]|jgi:catechol-2,3-dioxygenase|nr:VOC family protein [Chloroflexota bacterium]
MDTIKVTRLAHVGLRATDLSQQAAFYIDRWGLERTEEHGRALFLRAAGPAHHVLTLHEGGHGLDHVAFEVAHPDDIERAAELLSRQGIAIVTPPTRELEPGIAKAIRFADPEGNVVELVAGVDQVRDPYGPRDVTPQALNHVVLWANDRPAMEAFYRDLLGFKLSDNIGNFMTFWRCNANHHSLAFLCPRHDGQRGLQHAAFELRDWEEFMRAVFFMGERGVRRYWGPGRHLAGNNLFAYYYDPEGNIVEYTAEVEQIVDDANYVPPFRVPGPGVTDQWGSQPPDL